MSLNLTSLAKAVKNITIKLQIVLISITKGVKIYYLLDTLIVFLSSKERNSIDFVEEYKPYSQTI